MIRGYQALIAGFSASPSYSRLESMPDIKITEPSNNGDCMPDPIKGTYDLNSLELHTLNLTEEVFIHLVIIGKGPRGEYQSISGNAEIIDKENWKFDLVDNNVRLKPNFIYSITALLILSRIVQDSKYEIRYCEIERVIVEPKKPTAKKTKAG